MKELGVSYSDTRLMPIRYRTWYINRYSEYIEKYNELQREVMQESRSRRRSF